MNNVEFAILLVKYPAKFQDEDTNKQRRHQSFEKNMKHNTTFIIKKIYKQTQNQNQIKNRTCAARSVVRAVAAGRRAGALGRATAPSDDDDDAGDDGDDGEEDEGEGRASWGSVYSPCDS